MIRLSGSSSRKEIQDFVWSGTGDRTFTHSLGVMPDLVTLTYLSSVGGTPQFLNNGGQIMDHFWHSAQGAMFGHAVKSKSTTQVVITFWPWWEGAGTINIRLIMAIF